MSDTSQPTTKDESIRDAIQSLPLYGEYKFNLTHSAIPTDIHVLRLPGGLLYTTYCMDPLAGVAVHTTIGVDSSGNGYVPAPVYPSQSPTKYEYQFASQVYVPVSLITGV